MAIDNPLDAYEKQYPKPEFDPLTLTASITKHILVASAITQAIDTVRNALTGVSMNERLHAMWEVLRLSFEGLETRTDKTGVDLEEFKASIRIAFARDALEQSDKKRERYVKILGNAIVSDSR